MSWRVPGHDSGAPARCLSALWRFLRTPCCSLSVAKRFPYVPCRFSVCFATFVASAELLPPIRNRCVWLSTVTAFAVNSNGHRQVCNKEFTMGGRGGKTSSPRVGCDHNHTQRALPLCRPQTPNPEPRTPNPKPRTLNPKPQGLLLGMIGCAPATPQTPN